MIGILANTPWARRVPALILTASLAALGTAYTAQYAFDLEPCILCLYQRIPYAVTTALAGLMLLRPGAPVRYTFVIRLCGFVFLIGGGIAIYHVGVEQHWWAAVTACGAPPAIDITAAQMKAQLLTKPAKACDTVDWTFLGISMAVYNVAASLILATGCFAATRLIQRTIRGRPA